jgi:hypothetical protein
MQMNRTLIAATGLVAMALAMPAISTAQSLPTSQAGVTLRFGGFAPVDSGPRETSTVWPAVGGEMRLLSLRSKNSDNETVSLSVDWFGRNSWSETPVLLNYTQKFGSLFADAGAGFGFKNTPSGNGTNFAYQGGIGYNIPGTSPTTFFVEAKYRGSDNTELNGFAFYFGVRF